MKQSPAAGTILTPRSSDARGERLPHAISLRRWIDSKHLYELADLAQVVERFAGGFVVAAEEVDVENVFPRIAAARTRFDLRKTDVPKGENAQCFKQCPGNVKQ